MSDPTWQTYFLWMQERGITNPRYIAANPLENPAESHVDIPSDTDPVSLVPEYKIVFITDLVLNPNESILVENMATALNLSGSEWLSIPAIVDKSTLKDGVPNSQELDAMQKELWTRLPVASVYIAFGPLATRIAYGKGSFKSMQGNQLQDGNRTILPTFHPRDILRQAELKRDVWKALQSTLSLWEISS